MYNVKRAKRDLERNGLSAFLDPLAYSSDGLYICKEKIGFAIAMQPLNYPNNDSYKMLKSLFEGICPENSFLNVTLVASNRISHITNSILNLRNDYMGKNNDTFDNSDLYLKFFERLANYYEKATEESPINTFDFKIKDYFVVMSLVLPIGELGLTEKIQKEVLDCKTAIMSTLKSVGIYAINIKPEFLIRIYREILYMYMPESEISPYIFDKNGNPTYTWDKNELLCNQIPLNNAPVEIHKDYVKIGDTYIGSLSVKMYPEEFSLFQTIFYIGHIIDRNRSLPFNYTITLNTYIPEQEKTIGEVKSNSLWISRQAFGPIQKFVPQIGLKKEGYDILVDSIVKESDWCVKSYLNINVYAKSVEELKENMTAFESYYRTLGFILNSDSYITFELILNNLPLNIDVNLVKDLHRYRTMSSSNATTLLPITSDWKGSKTPVLSFISRRGQLMTLDLFDSQGGFSGCVFAKTGSGKSFFVNDLIVSYLSLNSRIWVVDAGRSYMKLCEMLGGQFIEFTLDKDISLNPFTKIVDIKEDIQTLKTLIASMCKPNDGVNDYEMSQLERILNEIFQEKGNEACIDDVAEKLLNEEDERLQDLGSSLFPFTSNGVYGDYFNKPCNINFDSNFVVLELDELKSHPILQSIVLLVNMMIVQQEMYLSDRSRRKLLIVDESWDLLNKGNVGEFLMGGYRRFRKYRGSALIISQSVNDLYNSKTGEAIAENSDFYFLLAQKKESIEGFKRKGQLSFSDFEYNLLESVHTERGSYSEVFIYSSTNGKGIGRLIRNRYTQLLFTTDPTELSILQKLRKELSLSLGETIEAYIEAEKEFGQNELEYNIDRYISKVLENKEKRGKNSVLVG